MRQPTEGSISIRTDADIVMSRAMVRRLTQDLEFSLVDQTKMVTAASELARNTVDYGGGGSVQLAVLEDGVVVTTDGPFAESKEQIGGFWVVEAPDLDAALALAAKGSAACMGPVEVRPFQGEPEA